MLRLRMAAGEVTKEKLKFIIEIIEEYHVPKIKFTTRQSIEVHGIDDEKILEEIANQAANIGIDTFGAGKDTPRNVMCSPLSGVETGECFDVRSCALYASTYLANLEITGKMPRRLKACFASSPSNRIHAIYSDLGFVAREDGTFDVYSAGGLGNDPAMGVLVDQGVAKEKFLYYLDAMWLTFKAYADPINPVRSKTRYMQRKMGTEEYKRAYLEKLQESMKEDLDIIIPEESIQKRGNETIEHRLIHPQKQTGLYYIIYHPLYGIPDMPTFLQLAKKILAIEESEIRIGPDQNIYLINLTVQEAKELLTIIENDQAKSQFETSVSCKGATKCRMGLMDSMGMLERCIFELREKGIEKDSLPQIHISGCTSSCGTHQIGVMGLRGEMKKINDQKVHGYLLYLGRHDDLGKEMGFIPEEKVPEFFIELGTTIQSMHTNYNQFLTDHYDLLENIIQKYTI